MGTYYDDGVIAGIVIAALLGPLVLCALILLCAKFCCQRCGTHYEPVQKIHKVQQAPPPKTREIVLPDFTPVVTEERQQRAVAEKVAGKEYALLEQQIAESKAQASYKPPVTREIVVPQRQSFQMDWNRVQPKMPMTRSDQDKIDRKALWSKFDTTGKKSIGLPQALEGARRHLRLEDDVTSGDPEDIYRTVIPAAFEKAASVDGSVGGNTVEKVEFRVLLVFIRQFLEIFGIFDEIDSNGSGSIDSSEFAKSKPFITRLGGTMGDTDAEFRAIDRDHSGRLDFKEFVNWALTKNLKLTDGTHDDPALHGVYEKKSSRVGHDEVTGSRRSTGVYSTQLPTTISTHQSAPTYESAVDTF